MFGLGPATKIYISLDAVDMRKGFEGLYGLVRDQLGQDPLSGHLFLFTNRTHTRLKAPPGFPYCHKYASWLLPRRSCICTGTVVSSACRYAACRRSLRIA